MFDVLLLFLSNAGLGTLLKSPMMMIFEFSGRFFSFFIIVLESCLYSFDLWWVFWGRYKHSINMVSFRRLNNSPVALPGILSICSFCRKGNQFFLKIIHVPWPLLLVSLMVYGARESENTV
jgi:hypothetical protein